VPFRYGRFDLLGDFLRRRNFVPKVCLDPARQLQPDKLVEQRTNAVARFEGEKSNGDTPTRDGSIA
jgi:hypothetical protein